MRCLVTGGAGFIGSHLVERLRLEQHDVLSVDCFTDYYPIAQKRRNAAGSPRIDERDLASAPLDDLMPGVDTIFHLAGQPGVRLSWAEGFRLYVERNLIATQRLLESATEHGVRRFVLASSSSVYGEVQSYPTREDAVTRPFSPYGVTKLAAESLLGTYAANCDIETIALRYFTVYGPRQRPDMAIHRFIEQTLDGRPVPVYGDGSQLRDFTYVDDIVQATILAATAKVAECPAINIAGGRSISVSAVLDIIAESTAHRIKIDSQPRGQGDVSVTAGDIEAAGRLLNWQPTTSVQEGITRQVEWHLDRRGDGATLL